MMEDQKKTRSLPRHIYEPISRSVSSNNLNITEVEEFINMEIEKDKKLEKIQGFIENEQKKDEEAKENQDKDKRDEESYKISKNIQEFMKKVIEKNCLPMEFSRNSKNKENTDNMCEIIKNEEHINTSASLPSKPLYHGVKNSCQKRSRSLLYSIKHPTSTQARPPPPYYPPGPPPSYFVHLSSPPFIPGRNTIPPPRFLQPPQKTNHEENLILQKIKDRKTNDRLLKTLEDIITWSTFITNNSTEDNGYVESKKTQIKAKILNFKLNIVAIQADIYAD